MKFSVSDETDRGKLYDGWRTTDTVKPTEEEIAAMCGVYPLLPKLLGPEVAAMVEVVKVRFGQSQQSQDLVPILTAILSNEKVPGWKLQVEWSPFLLEAPYSADGVSEEHPLPYRKVRRGPYPTQLVAERFALQIKKEICQSADLLIASLENLKKVATN